MNFINEITYLAYRITNDYSKAQALVSEYIKTWRSDSSYVHRAVRQFTGEDADAYLIQDFLIWLARGQPEAEQTIEALTTQLSQDEEQWVEKLIHIFFTQDRKDFLKMEDN